MKLVLYSDQLARASAQLDAELLRLLHGTSHRVAFVPSATDRNDRYFGDASSHYRRLGMPAPSLCDVGDAWDPTAFEAALTHDAIHLGSGDPAVLLASLRRHAVGPDLQRFSARGGVLVGVSAGAMVLSASIALADAASFNGAGRAGARARPSKAGRGARALGFVDFHFYPHFSGSSAERERLTGFSRTHNCVVVACDDAAGVVVEDAQPTWVGHPTRFVQGCVDEG